MGATKDKMNTVEDRVFKDFCRNIGVKNIRQYEERELKTQQERWKKKVEYENQINRITTQLEYELKREDQLQRNVSKFERMVQDIEDQMKAAKTAEQTQMQEIDTDMQAVEKLKSQKQHLKTEVDKIEDEVSAAKKDVSNVQKELASISKQIGQLESNLDSERAMLDTIQIPMKKGRLDEIDDDVVEDPSIEMSSSQP